MDTLITLLIVLLSFTAGYGLDLAYRKYDEKKEQKKILNDFKASQQEIVKGLTEKKEALSKTMATEIRDRTAALEADYQRKKQSAEDDLERLSFEYREKTERYRQLDLERENERQEKNAKDLIEAKERFDKELDKITNEYEEKKELCSKNFQLWKENIDTVKATLSDEVKAFEEQRKSITEYLKQEEEIRLQKDYYHIALSDLELQDVSKLKALSTSFSKPEVLHKIIYEMYYKAKMEELFKRVLGDKKDQGGIYKITNITSGKAYVGKTTKFLDRWRTHAKRGCGIERIAGQIYDAMFKEGLENFTWEIVEVCPKEEQTEKEKYWIKFLQTDQFGYNMKVG